MEKRVEERNMVLKKYVKECNLLRHNLSRLKRWLSLGELPQALRMKYKTR
jgi:hypothetical protein